MDLDIIKERKLKPIAKLLKECKIKKYELYGDYKAKIIDLPRQKTGKLILVSAITPTQAGEGKTTVTIGIADGLRTLKKNSGVVLREPSIGPVLGLKGGACGGGNSQIAPMVDINLHFTGDFHAITSANNLISAVIDNHIYQGNDLEIDKDRVIFKRCLDINDRALREIEIGQGSKYNGVARKDSFQITAASEIMAIFCLSNDLDDFKKRVGEIRFGYNIKGEPLTVSDLRIENAVALLCKDAIKPNFVQTLEHTPALVHGGPFANIAHGCNSMIATKTALGLFDYVVTEAGFGSDLGLEKYCNIKTKLLDKDVDCFVLVATIRALKSHGNALNLAKEDLIALAEGIPNLAKHVEIVKLFGTPFVIALNIFDGDTPKEIALVMKWANDHNYPIAISENYKYGGLGAQKLASLILDNLEKENNFHRLYDRGQAKSKIEKIVFDVYGAKEIKYSLRAQEQLKEFNKDIYDDYFICMAKTPLSISQDPNLRGWPKDFTITVKDIDIRAGAKFLVVITGNTLTMPGLPKEPSALSMDVVDGEVFGKF